MTLSKIQTVIGLDIGKKYSWCQAVSMEGKVLKQMRVENRPESFQSFLQDLPSSIRLVMEATSNWQYIYESWEDLVQEVQMAHPLKTKAIASARIKTDKIDAGVLAHLGRADLVPQSYIPSREVRDLREVLRHRAFFVKVQTQTKNRIHSTLGKLGLAPPVSDLFGSAGLEWLKAVQLREPYRDEVDQSLALLFAVQDEIKQITKTIDSLAKEDPRAAWLLPIRGCGKYSVMLILAEIGEVERFKDPRKLISFAGLCPSTYQSGDRCFHGRITKQGSKWLRWILVEAAQKYSEAPGRLGDFFRRIEYRKGAKTARVALARELLTHIFYCLKKEVVFQEHPLKRRQKTSQHAPKMSGRKRRPIE